MKPSKQTQEALFTLLLSTLLAGALPAQENKSAPPDARVVEQMVTVTATVEAVDLAKREVILKGPLGNVHTFVVSDQVKRLDEIKPGDKVNAKYYIGMAAELRSPTPEEEKEPFVVLKERGRAPSGSAPAGADVRVIRVVATVEGLDRPTQTVTLKGPRGNYLTVRVKDPSVLEKPRLGDTVVVTCAEAVALSVEKVKDKE